MKDTLVHRRLARVSVYDVLDTGSSVESLLRRPDEAAVEALQTLIAERVHEV